MGTPVLRICNKSALFIILSLALFSCRKQDNIFVTEVISVNLSQSELLMVKDDTCMLNATVLPRECHIQDCDMAFKQHSCSNC